MTCVDIWCLHGMAGVNKKEIVLGLSWLQNSCIMKYVSMFWGFHSLLILLIVNLSTECFPWLIHFISRKTGNKSITPVHRTCRRRMKLPMKSPVILLLSGSTAEHRECQAQVFLGLPWINILLATRTCSFGLLLCFHVYAKPSLFPLLFL